MRARTVSRYVHDPVGFIDRFVSRNELGHPFRLEPHQREILRLAFAFDAEGKLPVDTIVYSCPKKSGKTTINAVVVLWWAFCQEPPNEVLICANDLEQAQARVFKTLVALLQHNPGLGFTGDPSARQVTLSNGTTVLAIAKEYAGAAGSNHGLTSWDELWAYTSEPSRRLWEELAPVPTRQNSIRFITTYAGYEGESLLLRDLYEQGVGPEEFLQGQGERLHPALPVYGNRMAALFTYWDHELRMPWQTEAFIRRQRSRRDFRPMAWLRLWLNRWTTTASTFLTPELYDPSVDRELRPLLPNKIHQIYVGVDAGITGDNAGVVGVTREGDRVRLAVHRIWRPSQSAPLDLENTIEAYLRDLHDCYDVRQILCDPYQLHRSITTLKAAGMRIEGFPQTSANTTRMGQAVFEAFKGRTLRLYPDEELRQQALNTVAIESSRGWRIAKEKASRKIDAIVALSMALVAALEQSVWVCSLCGDPACCGLHGGGAPEPESPEAHGLPTPQEVDRPIAMGIKHSGVYFPSDPAAW